MGGGGAAAGAAAAPAGAPRGTVAAAADAVNRWSKWVAVVAAAGTAAWRRDAGVAWALTGAVVNAANAKVLKRVLKQPRPPGTAAAPPRGYGMPSAHAMSAAYLATYAALALLSWNRRPATAAAAAGIAAACATGAALRVTSGMHTTWQVLAGAAAGSATAAVWYAIWHATLRHCASAPPFIAAGFALACAACIVLLFRSKH